MGFPARSRGAHPGLPAFALPAFALPAFALAAFALAACAAGGPAPSRARVEVGGAPVAIAGPPGFCVDRQSTEVDRNGAFVLLTDCALLGGSGQGRVPIGAALTASLSAETPQGEGDAVPGETSIDTLANLARYAASGEGRALIGLSGEGGRTSIVATRRLQDGLFLLVEDRGPQPVAGIAPRFWRGFIDLDGRLVVLSVLSFEGGGVDDQEGLNLIAAFAGAMRRANPAAPAR